MQKPSALIFVSGGNGYDTHEAYMAKISQGHWSLVPYTGENKDWKKKIADYFVEKEQVVYLPTFPCKHNAKYEEWKLWFDILMQKIDDNGVYVGHSLGGNFLAKYFLESGKKAREIHMVSPDFGEPGGFNLPDDLSGIEENVEQIHLWYSKDEPYIPLSEFAQYISGIPDLIVHELDGYGHFNTGDFPEIESYILQKFGI